jgi:hypothetical protein
MHARDKYRAKIEARMDRFNETMEEIRAKSKVREDLKPDVNIDSIAAKKYAAAAKLKELEASGEGSWQKFKNDLDELMDGIDTELRRAI